VVAGLSLGWHDKSRGFLERLARVALWSASLEKGPILKGVYSISAMHTRLKIWGANVSMEDSWIPSPPSHNQNEMWSRNFLDDPFCAFITGKPGVLCTLVSHVASLEQAEYMTGQLWSDIAFREKTGSADYRR